MKTKITIKEDDFFPMGKMKPGQLCIIQDGPDKGCYCIKTIRLNELHIIKFYGMKFWDGSDNTALVKKAPKGTKITFEVI